MYKAEPRFIGLEGLRGNEREIYRRDHFFQTRNNVLFIFVVKLDQNKNN